MRTIAHPLLPLLALAAIYASTAHAAEATTLRLYNPVGGISVEVGTVARLRIHGRGNNRSATKDDLKVARVGAVIAVQCDPPDNEPIDLEVQVPFDFLLDVTTEHGAISVSGMISRALLKTDRGTVSVSAPWRVTRFRLDARHKPAEFVKPRGYKFSEKAVDIINDQQLWRIEDRLADWRIAYGRVRVEANQPGRIELTDYSVPKDSPVKFPWQAPEILAGLLEPPEQRETPEAPVDDSEQAASLPGADPVFRSDVRMVNLIVAAYNKQGRPVTGLRKRDFDITEDGADQRIGNAGSDETPFNLAILLDLSGSTRPDRRSMKNAARRFVELARPRDRVAVYALAGSAFHVISRLTDEREALLETIARLPDASGASPLYDAVVLAYAEDFPQHPGERNALIVISDGIDNRISGQEMPSRVSFKKLLRGAAEMNALIYPVFLRSGERFGRGWSHRARKQMTKLAERSGGRLFPALSIQDLEPVFPLVEQELRSVYSLSYYPQNQAFDGTWRKVDVRVKRLGISIRSRDGYFAR